MSYRKALFSLSLLMMPLWLLSQQRSVSSDGSGNIQLKRAWASNSLFASGNWFKIEIDRSGIYKLTYNDLLSLGMTLPADASTIRVFGNGGAQLPELNGEAIHDELNEIAIWVNDGGDGSFNNASDYILFYGQGTELWQYDSVKAAFTHTLHDYADASCYFITSGTIAGKRIQVVPAIADPPSDTVNSYNYFIAHEIDRVNQLKSGRLWLGEEFSEDTVQGFYFDLPDIETDSPLKVRLKLFARSVAGSGFTCQINDTAVVVAVEPVDPNPNSEYAKGTDVIISCLPDTAGAVINLLYNRPDNASLGWLDFMEVNCTRKLVMHNGQFGFRNCSVTGAHISGFNLNNASGALRLWNISEPENIGELPYTLNGSDAFFKAYTDSLATFVAFDGSSYYVPRLIGKVDNQNLHGIAQADMVIVSHPDFMSQANRLADLHRNSDGLSVVVLTPGQIYNEFSSGMQDPTAIRDLMRMLYDRAASDSVSAPKYLLLFGDGSFDMKNRVPDNTNFIPTYQTKNSLTPTASFVSDDYFGLLETGEGPNVTGNVDIGIGRLPAETEAEAKLMTDKIINYDSPVDFAPDTASDFTVPGPVSNYADWRNTICFVADDEDNNLHLSQAEGLGKAADSVIIGYNIDKIYIDVFKQQNTPSGARYPDANVAINNRIGRGALIVNYTGHGSEAGWAAENILTLPEINAWSNRWNLPAFITATCEFSRFDNPVRRSAGEFILLNPNGGGIALFSTTRVAYAHSNEIINRMIIKSALKHTNGSYPRMGDAIREAKRACGTGVYMQNFVLLGDPALRLAYPELRVATTALNGMPTDSIHDTLTAGRTVTVQGAVVDYDGNTVNDFTGMVYPTVYDVPVKYMTQANDQWSSHQWFSVRNKVLYKGRVHVTNGLFSFAFVVPANVSFSPGNARISYYAKSSGHDAWGVYDSVCFVHDTIPFADQQGPDIKLFMDNTSFKPLDITGDNPVLLAALYDTNGIDAYGTRFGSDITAVLDDQYDNTIVLNDYYRAYPDTWTGGTLAFPFYDLASGLHKIRVRASDMLGNSSEAFCEFIVAHASDLDLGGVYNFPNPFISYTNFYIEHNQTLAPLRVQITVYDVQGSPVRTLQANVTSGDNKYFTLRWDGSDDYGGNLKQGLYVYRAKLSDDRGDYLERSGKLIILR